MSDAEDTVDSSTRFFINYAEPTFGIQRRGWVVIHPDYVCLGHHCPFHSPSDHTMSNWPINLRFDKELLVERLCSHGIGHPDPDSLAYLNRNRDQNYLAVHACDGCCGA